MTGASSDVPDLDSTSEREIVDLRGLGPFVSLGRYHYLAAHEPLPEQRHDHLLVLVLPLRNRVDVVLDGRAVAAGPGRVVRIRPRTGYRIGTGAQPRGDLLWLILHTAGPAGPALARVIDELGRAGRDVWPTSPLSVDLLSRALASPAGGEWLTAAWREALCTTAVIDLVRGLYEPEDSATVEHPGLRRALRWLDDHLEEPVTVSRLVEVSRMSASRFYETFTETFGTSPKDYVLRAKIARSERLLAESSDSVTRIAYRLGFSSSQYFASAFRRYVGVSPTEYRRRSAGAR
ncbi:MAG TPA: AraC family transcriptional regulator [Nonomuraea sp.]|nr:AraC family transcriptional regulator [Nonomuraea sp.]